MILALTILLTWADVANPPSTTYHVYRAPGGCGDGAPFERVTQTPQPTRSYKDTPPSGTYCYQVTAVVDGVESDPSPRISVQKPVPPSSLKVSPVRGSVPPAMPAAFWVSWAPAWSLRRIIPRAG
jgi:hypothetical protein